MLNSAAFGSGGPLRAALSVALVAVFLIGGGGAQPHTHTPAAPAGSHGAGTSHSAGTSHATTLGGLQGRPFDRAYLSMMIAHHEAAVEMSDALLARGRDARVRAWATEVRSLQVSEIREMTAMLRDFDLGGLDVSAHHAMGADMGEMVQAVRVGPNPDEAWVRGMLEHHALGLRMATEALLTSELERVRRSARAVARVQAEQMYEYRTWVGDR